MSEGLSRLIKLQELTLESLQIEETLAGLPERLAALESSLESAQASLTSARQEGDAATKQRRSLEQDLSETEQKISRYKDQLMSVKTNDEYRAMNHEISHERKRVDSLEEEILVLMESSEGLQQQIAVSQQAVSEAEQELGVERSAMEREQQQLEGRRETLAGELAKVEADIPEDLMKLYRRVAGVRGGVGMAAVVEENCSVCRVRVRPQVQSELRNSDTVYQCESCQRILYCLP